MFNPFTGQFESRSIAALDPAIYKDLKDGTSEVAEETAFVKEHVVKNKQHLRDIKARIRDIETALEKQNVSKDVLDMSSAMEIDLLHQRLDQVEKDVKLILESVNDSSAQLKQEIIDIKNKKTPSMVSIKIDEALEKKFQELETKQRLLKEGTDFESLVRAEETEKALKRMDRLDEKFMWSIYVSVATTVFIVALKLLF